MKLPIDYWYPVLESVELKRKPFSAERLGLKLVFWRDSKGQAHAQVDRCPHLGAALSGGSVVGDRLVCPFHGFEFNASGQCERIPANGNNSRIPDGMKCKNFTVTEADGLIWLWYGQPQTKYPPVPFFDEIGTGWSYHTNIVEWPVHYSRAIENQLDVAHLAFVHRTTIGRGGQSFVDGPHVETSANGINVWVSNSRDTGQTKKTQTQLIQQAANKLPGLSFKFPGTWLLNISPKLKNFIAFAPINDQCTRYYLRIYHRVNIPFIGNLFGWLMGQSNHFILKQDRKVVVTQVPNCSLDASEDRLIGADRAIIEFRKWQKNKVGDTK